MIVLLTGENTFAIQDAVSAELNQARSTIGADAITIVDGSALGVSDLPQLLLGVTLFATDRLILIRDAAANKLVWDKLADILPDVDQQTTVVLVAPTADKRTKTYKWLQKHAEVREATILNEAQLVKWLQTQVDIKPDLARYLIEYVGPDQWRLGQELEKLSLSEQPITRELIQQLIEPNPQASAFQLLDAIMAGKKTEAERLFHSAQGNEDPYRFVGLLANQVYALVLCAQAGSRDATTIARDSGIHPFVIKKLLPVGRRITPQQTTKLVDILADLDRQLKSTGTDPWTLIRVAVNSIQV